MTLEEKKSFRIKDNTKENSRVQKKERTGNNSFHFAVNGDKVRVCKLFFKNTLDVNDRVIRTVSEKRMSQSNVVVAPDRRGKHANHHSIDPVAKQGVLDHINSIPRIESHYLRSPTKRQYICGSNTIAGIHRDYVNICKGNNMTPVSYPIFWRIFKEDFNIMFHTPKKDQCDICLAFENASETEKTELLEMQQHHLKEKEFSRAEKWKDKENARVEVAVYDLQAVMQLRKGNNCLFYYVSKLMF